jgi:hypothetical protein
MSSNFLKGVTKTKSKYEEYHRSKRRTCEERSGPIDSTKALRLNLQQYEQCKCFKIDRVQTFARQLFQRRENAEETSDISGGKDNLSINYLKVKHDEYDNLSGSASTYPRD